MEATPTEQSGAERGPRRRPASEAAYRKPHHTLPLDQPNRQAYYKSKKPYSLNPA